MRVNRLRGNFRNWPIATFHATQHFDRFRGEADIGKPRLQKLDLTSE
jgi:hypothetical protein